MSLKNVHPGSSQASSISGSLATPLRLGVPFVRRVVPPQTVWVRLSSSRLAVRLVNTCDNRGTSMAIGELAT
jgi:hypothetical protein